MIRWMNEWAYKKLRKSERENIPASKPKQTANLKNHHQHGRRCDRAECIRFWKITFHDRFILNIPVIWTWICISLSQKEKAYHSHIGGICLRLLNTDGLSRWPLRPRAVSHDKTYGGEGLAAACWVGLASLQGLFRPPPPRCPLAPLEEESRKGHRHPQYLPNCPIHPPHYHFLPLFSGHPQQRIPTANKLRNCKLIWKNDFALVGDCHERVELAGWLLAAPYLVQLLGGSIQKNPAPVGTLLLWTSDSAPHSEKPKAILLLPLTATPVETQILLAPGLQMCIPCCATTQKVASGSSKWSFCTLPRTSLRDQLLAFLLLPSAVWMGEAESDTSPTQHQKKQLWNCFCTSKPSGKEVLRTTLPQKHKREACPATGTNSKGPLQVSWRIPLLHHSHRKCAPKEQGISAKSLLPVSHHLAACHPKCNFGLRSQARTMPGKSNPPDPPALEPTDFRRLCMWYIDPFLFA